LGSEIRISLVEEQKTDSTLKPKYRQGGKKTEAKASNDVGTHAKGLFREEKKADAAVRQGMRGTTGLPEVSRR